MEQKSRQVLDLHKLDLINHNYITNCKRPFDSFYFFPTEQIIKCIQFAFSMTFGKKGELRTKRSGGKKDRQLIEKFQDALHGKLAEYGFYNSYKAKYPDIAINEPDLNCWKLGKWDFTDFEITYNNKKAYIAVKSTKSYSNLLLLEKEVFNKNGIYVPNKIQFNKIVLVRISSYLNYDNLIIFTHKKKYILNQHFMTVLKSGICQFINYDIAGYITIDDLKEIINQGQIIKQDYTLNDDTIIDVDNYYIQAGDLREWIPAVKE